MNEAAQLNRIRDQVGQIAPGDWTRVHDSAGCFVEARGLMGELVPMARFGPDASEAEIEFAVEAPTNVRFLLGLVDRAIKAMRPAAVEPDEGPEVPSRAQIGTGSDHAKNYAAEAAMRCGDPAFKAFLEHRHGLERPLTDDRVAQKLRSLLGVTSRRELNRSDAAVARWKALKGDFENWKRVG